MSYAEWPYGGPAPLAGRSGLQILTEDFVLKTNPVVFGPLNMNFNTISNLQYGTSLYDAAAYGQISGGGGGASGASVGVASSVVTLGPNYSEFRSNGPVLVPPTSRQLYPTLPSGYDVIDIIPGCASSNILQTTWTLTRSNIPSLSGYTLGTYNWNTFPYSVKTLSCIFKCNVSNSFGAPSAELVVFSWESQSVLAQASKPLASGNQEVELTTNIGFQSLQALDEIAVALRVFVPSTSTIVLTDFQLIGIYFR